MPFENTKLWMGPGTFHIPLELFSLNRTRLVDRLKSFVEEDKAVVVLQGGKETPLYDTDRDRFFIQESYFRWAFGVSEAGCYGAIEVNTGISHLFIPRYPESYAVWMGRLHTPDEFRDKYGVDNVQYTDEITDLLKTLNTTLLLTLHGVNSDSRLKPAKVQFEGIEEFTINNKILYPEIAELRVIKTNYELDVMRYINEITSAAHKTVMKMVKPGKMEYYYEAEFLHYIYSVGGCRTVPYICICCSGHNGAILDYGHAGAPGDRMLKDGDMCLFDMGANYFGYSSDVTCSFPVNGIFTADQKLIYEAVLKANLAVAKEARPGVSWPCLHLLATRVLLSGLKDGGLLQGDVSEMVTAGLGSIFQPHGLGHLLGLDVHDVGGYLPDCPTRLVAPKGLEYLRTARILKKGMVFTIEPGCYFNECLLNRAFADSTLSKFLIPEAIERFREFGGVRIEDDVIVTDTGIKCMTTVPRTVEDIESWMAHEDDISEMLQ